MNISAGSRQVGPTVLFVSPSAYPFGGVAEWLDYLLPGLAQRGLHCVLGLVDGRHHSMQRYLERHPWEQVESIHNPTGSREGRILALQRAIERTRPDIVAVVNIVDAYEAVRRLRSSGSAIPRIAMTLHGLQPDLFADIAAERDVLDAVVVTNRLTQRLVADALGLPGRVLYAPYGVPAQADAQKLAPPFSKGLRLLYAGRIEESQKRVLDLPILLGMLRDSSVPATLSIAGGGPDEPALRDRFEGLGLGQSVWFLGVLDANALSTAYRDHDALIITSTWETGPIVAWEAMSHGLPVISSQYLGSGSEGALMDGVNSLLFGVGDMAAAAAAVSRLADADVRSAIVRGGHELVDSRYSRQASIGHWADVFARILGQPILPVPVERSKTRASGRLDRLLGAAFAERVRRAVGVSFDHREPGGEWPHTAHPGIDETAWIADAVRHDFREQAP